MSGRALTTTAWTKDELRRIAETDDLHVSPYREDGVTYGTPTRIWSVVIDDALYVRAYNGTRSRWYKAALRQELKMTAWPKVPFLALILMLAGHTGAFAQQAGMLVRISEIQVDSNYLGQYKAILKEEAEASVRLEPGVIAIFPMYQRENPTEVRILEIYASREAYESRLQTPHFQHYKTAALPMVKSLKLVDMDMTDPATMARIFRKMAATSDARLRQ